MKKHNFLFIILLGVILSNCGGAKKENNSLFTFDTNLFKAQYLPQESVELTLLNPNSKTVDSVVYYVNESKIGTTKGLGKLTFDFKGQKLGYHNLKAIVYYEGELTEATDRVELVSNVEPKLLKYTIVNTFAHDTTAYTQGLEFYRDTLYEGTGNGSGPSGKKGISSLRKTNYKTGEIFKKIELSEQYFGEGITILNNKVYQLTWLNKAWFMLGLALGKLVSPIVLGVIFFGLITPIGLIARLMDRDELKLKRPKKSSYWSEPIGSNSDADSFKNQF